MKAIILVAGYATRLYPLTKNFPKPLLSVGKVTIIDHIVNKIEAVKEVNEIFVVTNNNFYEHFVKWRNDSTYNKKITVINDFTTSNENRLGALRDLYYVIESQKIDEDVLVLAGDNLFEFALTDMVSFYNEKMQNVITTHELGDVEALKRTGVIKVDGDNKVIDFVEKPTNPDSNLAVPPFYIYTKNTVEKWIGKYVEDNTQLDAPGNLVPYLIKNSSVYAFKFSGKRYDIGNLESYNKVKEIFHE